MSTKYSAEATVAAKNLIAFYKDKIAELEMFIDDLDAGKITVDQQDFSKYSVQSKPVDEKRVNYWRKNPDRKFDQSENDAFSIRLDDHYSEPIGVCDVAILDFANIIVEIRRESDEC